MCMLGKNVQIYQEHMKLSLTTIIELIKQQGVAFKSNSKKQILLSVALSYVYAHHS
jgi:DNA phosphorothioation-dependent restriction protein DptG